MTECRECEYNVYHGHHPACSRYDAKAQAELDAASERGEF